MSPEWSIEHDVEFYDFITVVYFSITCLSTVGYGDLVAKTNIEKVMSMFFMLVGVGFFSFIMGSFIEILQSFNFNHGIVDRTFELNNYMKLLLRFRENKPLPASLLKEIHNHFKYYWAHNRVKFVTPENEFIQGLPLNLTRAITLHFLFDDVFYNFRFFFNPMKYKESLFLYDVAFGLMPRHFTHEKEDESIILDEEEEVTEMYFIVSGQVGVGFHLYNQPLEKPRY
jgi:hypothetical protein